MSEKTKKAAEATKMYLGDAQENLRKAGDWAKETGDKKLVENVTKLREGTEQVRKVIEEKLNNG